MSEASRTEWIAAGTLNLSLMLGVVTPGLVACRDNDSQVSGVATTTGDTEEPGNADTGLGSGTSGGYVPPQCEHNETVIGLTEQSVVGLTPAEVIADGAGLYVGSLRWGQEGPVQYTGDAGPFGVEVEITHEGGEARSVEGELLVGCDHEGPCPCPDSVEVDVTLRFSTADGVFAEQVDAELVYTVDDSGFSAPGLSVRLQFQPDDTTGTLTSAALMVIDDFALQYLEFDLHPSDGAVSGSVTSVVEGMGVLGAGNIASLGAVRSLEDCGGFTYAGSACGLAGCAEAVGQSVHGVAPDACTCSSGQAYCFPAELEGEPEPTLYTRQLDDGYDLYDEVVAFPVNTDLGGPWRACADAPEVSLCGCPGGC